MSSVSADNLHKSFGSTVALNPTQFTIEDGEFAVIVGPSGCGKSTLLRLVAGLEVPTSGRVLFDGCDVSTLEPADRSVAMVFQSYALYPHLTVAQNIAFPLRMAKWPRVEIDAKVKAVAELLELKTLLDRHPRALSGGQRQRVSIGRAIVRDPSVLLLDEPLSNLDAELRVKMRYELARLHRQLGTTMIYVTHDQIEAMTLANRIFVMANGGVEQVGAPIDLYDAPVTIRVAQSIGSPAMNFMPVSVIKADNEAVVVALPGGGECHAAVRADGLCKGMQLTLGIRPEHLRADPDGLFGGEVKLFERLGPLSFAHLSNDDDENTRLVAQLPSDRRIVLNEVIRFSALPQHVYLFDADGVACPRVSP